MPIAIIGLFLALPVIPVPARFVVRRSDGSNLRKILQKRLKKLGYQSLPDLGRFRTH
jgi:hypothetical protein